MQIPLPYEDAARWADEILAQMTLEEKCRYVGGKDVFFTQSIDRLGVPSVMFSDATAGVVLRERFFEVTYQNAITTSVAFPAPLMLAASWNRGLAKSYAKSIGEECAANGIGVLLAPGFNLYRISQCGRNFEYFGEDPYLISSMVEHYVEGVQSTGTIATLKHFVANNTDYFRRKSNSIVDQRTLHEIYMPAFKAGIDAGAKAVMTSYNLLNGEWAGQSGYVINHLLRTVLGFKWLVMTDWWSVYDGERLARSGQDLEMPAGDATECFLEKIRLGVIDEADLDRMVKSILTTLKSMHLFERKPQPDLIKRFPEHEQIALQTAREGTVLLRNVNHILPLENNDEPILLLGDYIHKKACGGGSSYVKGYNQITQYQALHKLFGDNVHFDPSPTDEVIRNAKRIILSVGTEDAESWDRPFSLPVGEERYIKRIVDLNSNVIVLVNAGSGIRMTDWANKAAAIVFCFYNGQNGNIALADILSGEVNPSGKLPFTIEKEFSDGPGSGYVPENEALYYGENDAWEKAHPVYDVEYKEGVFVGYRWFDAKHIEPLYPFGFGLSYTQFHYEELELSTQSITREQLNHGDTIDVSLVLTNSGHRGGQEIIQLYVSDQESSEPRPPRELKGFEKIHLNAGESQTVTLKLDKNAFQFWSDQSKDWTVEPGIFDIYIGSSSRDLALKASLEVQ